MIKDITLAFKTQWKVLLISLVAQLLMTVALHIGLQAPKIFDLFYLPNLQAKVQLISPQKGNPADTAHQQDGVWNQIQQKLEQKQNTFQLKNESSMIPSAYAAGEYDQALGYVVVDLDTGNVLASKNDQAQLAPASLTKVMSAVVALDLASPEERFTVSGAAANMQPTKIGVVEGQSMTLDELLHAALMTSANDSVEVIKDGINTKYQQDIFVKAINTKASLLGLKNTHFENPQGLDSQAQFSSASDLAILSAYALKNYPEIGNIVKKDYQFLPADLNHKQFDLYNWNGLLGVYPGVEGLKIGNTENAGYTTIVASSREGHQVLVVLLGAPGVLERDLWASQLLDLGFEKLGLPAANITSEQLKQKYSTWKYWG